MENNKKDKDFETHWRQVKLFQCEEELTGKQFLTLQSALSENNFTRFDNALRLYKSINKVKKNSHKEIIENNDENEELQEHTQANEIYSTKFHNQLNLALNEVANQKISINELLSEKQALVSEKNSLIKTLNKLNERLNNLSRENESLKSKIQQDRIDDKIPSYVQGVKQKLQQDDKYFSNLSYNWARAGLLLGALAVIAAFTTLFLKIDIKNASAMEILYYFVRGLLGVGLLSWLSFHALNNSKKFTHESIIRKDRQHALMFGEVFLQIYGSTSTKEDAINVFKDWNVSAKSAFSDPIRQPPNVLSILSMLKSKESVKESVKQNE